LVFGGYGLGRDSAGVVLIPGVAEGELVEFANDGTKGGTRVGRVAKIVEESPLRRAAPCAYAEECGGCDWLHLLYGEQARCKKEIFLDCATRIGKFGHPSGIEIFTANEFGYRMRAQIKIDRQNKRAGFFRRKTNGVVRIDECPLLVDGINGVLARLNSGMVDAFPDRVQNIRVLAGQSVASSPAIAGLTSASTEINVSGIKFIADGGSFFQSNRFLLEKLGRWAQGRLGGGYCMDLYGGIGFFSLMLADDFDGIALVECLPAQIKAAERNFQINGKLRIKAILADVESGAWIGAECGKRLGELTKRSAPDCVIIDPPRPGLAKSVRNWLISAAPPAILYVSCNPPTFARDAGALIRGGYKLADWSLFDLYPNTHHIESAAIFYRR
jgi:23S rRNA (uracil1939-C5)-methyltransferase